MKKTEYYSPLIPYPMNSSQNYKTYTEMWAWLALGNWKGKGEPQKKQQKKKTLSTSITYPAYVRLKGISQRYDTDVCNCSGDAEVVVVG